MSRSFTIRSNSLARELKSNAKVAEAFDSKSTPRSEWPSFISCTAIWDTGATNSSIHPDLAQKLNLLPTGKVSVTGVHGIKQVNKYLISIILPNEVGWEAVPVSETKFVGGKRLIGMDLITKGDLAVSNFGGITAFSFRTPSQEIIDFEKQKILSKKIPRNARVTIKNKATGEVKTDKWKKLEKLVELGNWDIENVEG